MKKIRHHMPAFLSGVLAASILWLIFICWHSIRTKDAFLFCQMEAAAGARHILISGEEMTPSEVVIYFGMIEKFVDAMDDAQLIFPLLSNLDIPLSQWEPSRTFLKENDSMLSDAIKSIEQNTGGYSK